MKKIIYFVLVFTMAGAISALVATAAKADCTTDRIIGIGKADRLDAAMQLYDSKAAIYNQNIKKADTAFNAGEDVSKIWPLVLIARDSLLQTGQKAQIALKDMNSFNQQYLQAGCFRANAAQLEQEFQKNNTTLITALDTLKKVPDNWQDRYNAAKVCRTLKEHEKQNNIKGANWAAAHDGLIKAYDEARADTQQVTPSDPKYLELRSKMILARDQALPGVSGYSSILAGLYDLTLLRLKKGCFAMTPAALQSYHNQQTVLQTEIRTKLLEMKNLEQDFPLVTAPPPPAPITPTISPAAPTPAATAPIAAAPALRQSPENPDFISGPILLRNRSGDILCLYDASSKETACDLMPGAVRNIITTNITAFGGGYWSQNGKYLDMKTCRVLKPANQEQTVHKGLEPNCTAPDP